MVPISTQNFSKMLINHGIGNILAKHHQGLLYIFCKLADQSQATTVLPQQRKRVFSSQPAASYTLQRLTVGDKDRVIDFVNRFYRDEPLNVAVNLFETPDSRSQELEEHSAASLRHGVSVAAVDSTGSLVSVMFSDIVKRKEGVYTNKAKHCPDPKFSRILQVLEHLESQACWWEHVPETCNTALYMSVGATHTTWRGMGFCTMFVEESERIAKEIGAGVIRMDCTSAYTAMIAEKLKYRKLCGVRYKDLPFAPQPAPPHDEASLYIKIL